MFAKIFLSIGALLAIALLVLVILRVRNEKEVSRIWQTLEAKPAGELFTEDMVIALPAPAKRYFLHAIAPGTPLATSVSLEMRGSFRTGQDKQWLPMQAKEIISAKGFVWKATIGRGLFQLPGADYYVNGLGRMRFSLWGLLPFVNAHSPDITRSSIGRLAGEFIWLPSALLPQQGVSWETIDEKTTQASLKIDGEPIMLRLVVDTDGKLLKVSLPRWSNQTKDGSWTYIPFGCKAQEERSFGGFTIPSQMSGGWWFGREQYFEFLQAKIERAEFR